MVETKRQFTEIKLPVPWGHVAGKSYGPSTGMRVLLVHGTLDNCGSFDRLLTLLPEEYHYVSIDLPGHGYSSHFPPGVPLEFFNYVHTISLVLKGLNWDTCTYIGHSFGAQIGIYFSILYPNRLLKIVALDGLSPYPIPDDEAISYLLKKYDLESYGKNNNKTFTKEQIIYVLKNKRVATLNTAAAEALFERAVTKEGDLYRYNRDPRMRISVKFLLNSEQQIEILKKISCPFLLFVGPSNTPVSIHREMMYRIFKNLDKSKFKVIMAPGNHDIHNNNPEIVAPHICKFLSDKIESKL